MVSLLDKPFSKRWLLTAVSLFSFYILKEGKLWGRKVWVWEDGGWLWVGEWMTCHHIFHGLAVWDKNVSFLSASQFKDNRNFSLSLFALIQLPNTCRHAITVSVPRHPPHHHRFLKMVLCWKNIIIFHVAIESRVTHLPSLKLKK